MSNRILRNTTAYMLAGLIPNLVNLLLLPLYTRKISPADYGINALVMMTCSVLTAFGGLQLGSALTRFYVTHKGQALRSYFSTLFFTSLISNLILFQLLQIAGPWMTQNLFGNSAFPYYPYMFLGAFQFVFGTQTAFLNIALRMQERGGRFLLLALIYTAVDFTIGLYLVLAREMGVVGLLTARAISSGVYTFLLIYTLRKLFTLKLNRAGLTESIRYSLPTIPHALANTVFNFADKFLLGHFLNPASVGLYDLANRFSRVFQRVIQGFERAYVPDFFRHSEISKVEAAAYLERMMSKWMVYCVLAAIGLSLFAEEVINVLADPKYHDAYALIPILVSGCILRGLYYFPANAILYDKRTHLIPLVTVSSGLLNIGLNLWLIPLIGTPDVAAWTTTVSIGFSFVLTGILSQRHYPLRWPWFTFAFMMTGMGAAIWIATHIHAETLWIALILKGKILLVFVALILFANVGESRKDLFWALSHPAKLWKRLRKR